MDMRANAVQQQTPPKRVPVNQSMHQQLKVLAAQRAVPLQDLCEDLLNLGLKTMASENTEQGTAA